MLAQTGARQFVSSNQLNQQRNKQTTVWHPSSIKIVGRDRQETSPLKRIMYRTCSFCYQDVLLISSMMEPLPQVLRVVPAWSWLMMELCRVNKITMRETVMFHKSSYNVLTTSSLPLLPHLLRWRERELKEREVRWGNNIKAVKLSRLSVSLACASNVLSCPGLPPSDIIWDQFIRPDL